MANCRLDAINFVDEVISEVVTRHLTVAGDVGVGWLRLVQDVANGCPAFPRVAAGCADT